MTAIYTDSYFVISRKNTGCRKGSSRWGRRPAGSPASVFSYTGRLREREIQKICLHYPYKYYIIIVVSGNIVGH